MTDEQIIELMARAWFDAHLGTGSYDDADKPDREDAHACLKAALSALRSAGMAVVPREPTDDMLSAGISERHSQPPAVKIAWSMATANIYRAMINTAEGKTE